MDYVIGYPPLDYGPRFPTLAECKAFLTTMYGVPLNDMNLEMVNKAFFILTGCNESARFKAHISVCPKRRPEQWGYPYGTFSEQGTGKLMQWREGMLKPAAFDSSQDARHTI